MLPDKLSDEFKEGNFVIKLTDSKFNQVDPDQAQELFNATGQKKWWNGWDNKNLYSIK